MISDKTLTDFRLCLDSVRAYLDTAIKSINAGALSDVDAHASTLALAKGQIEAIGKTMDAESPELAAAVASADAAVKP